MDQPVFLEAHKEEMVEKINHALNTGFERMETLISEERTVENKIASMRLVYGIVDEVFAIIKPYMVNAKIQCQKGCSHCCDIRVEALPVEAINIARFLREKEHGNIQKWIDKLEEHRKYAKDRLEEGFKRTCPFLDGDGACQIHDVRPYKCRVYHSIDAERCKTKRQCYKIGMTVQLDSLMVNNIMEQFGLNKLPLMPAELGQAVLMVLKDPTCAETWMKGVNPFPMLPEYQGQMGQRKDH